LNRISLISDLARYLLAGALLSGCSQFPAKQPPPFFYGTLQPFASNSVYFVMTDRFVDGDLRNDFPQQGGEHPTYRLPLNGPHGEVAYVGYMGGDFKGILDNAGYIKDLGFDAIWLTPIVDQPDESFSGGEPISYGGAFKDGGKTGYHGYWGSNFFQVDEHLPSENLSFQQLAEALRAQYGIKTVLDIVCNHASPAWGMPRAQAKFGQVFDANNQLVADEQNLPPEQLDAANPLHQFFNLRPDIAQLADFNADNPAVLNYFVAAYSHWIDQGADAFRIDTIKHMPLDFWKKFSDAIRKRYPEFFMFAEAYSFDANFIAAYTQPQNGAISVLDFPGREAMTQVFEHPGSDYALLDKYLYLQNSPYENAYDLMTFYDNHDMTRLNADTNGFIDANNWLFTARGIPVVYYGSEIGFMAGKPEHQGNRNYLGQEKIDTAPNSPIYRSLKAIANLRRQSPALQRGLQVNVTLKGDLAVFYRVYEYQGQYQTALVLLNKGDNPSQVAVEKWLSSGHWREAFTGKTLTVARDGRITHDLAPHSVAVYLLDEPNRHSSLRRLLSERMTPVVVSR